MIMGSPHKPIRSEVPEERDNEFNKLSRPISTSMYSSLSFSLERYSASAVDQRLKAG